MPARQLLSDLGHALRTFLDLDEEGEIPTWDRFATFQLDRLERGIWAEMPCAEAPPKAYLLMTRRHDDEVWYELLWAHGGTERDWPVVEVSSLGDAQVLARNAEDYLDALLFTCGRLGGGSEEDLVAARAEAGVAALELADQLAAELDREPPDPEALGERCDEAQDQFADAWFEAVEGLD